MNCKLCNKLAKPGKGVISSGTFLIHLNCEPGKKSNPKNKKKLAEYQSKKKKDHNPFIAPKNARGWRDIA